MVFILKNVCIMIILGNDADIIDNNYINCQTIKVILTINHCSSFFPGVLNVPRREKIAVRLLDIDVSDPASLSHVPELTGIVRENGQGKYRVSQISFKFQVSSLFP